MSIKEYPIVVFYSEEDNSWIADIPDIKYCSASGDTPEEAIRELQIALQGWIEAAKKNNIALPEPSHKPELMPLAS